LAQQARRVAGLILAHRHGPQDADRIMVEPADLAALIEGLSPTALLGKLSTAISELTAAEDKRWTLSPCDVALTGPITHSGTTMLLLHPAGEAITGLAEMPDHMRIIGIVTYAPYRLFRRPPEPPSDIAEHRRRAPAYEADRKSLEDVANLYHRLLALCRKASMEDLDPEVAALAEDQYYQARNLSPDQGLVHAIRAASALGIISHVFSGVLGD